MKCLFHKWDLPVYSPVVTICTASLTHTNSIFCPHSVFMCFVWTWEKPAFFSPHNINWLLFIYGTKSTYCAVLTEWNVKTEQYFWYNLVQDIGLIVMLLGEHRVISSNSNPQFSFHSCFFNISFYRQHKIP